MPIVTDPSETRRFLETLRRCRVAVPCFCTENAWTTEAVLEATVEAGRRFGIAEPPVCIAFTAGYPGRSNLSDYWTCGDQALGLSGLLGDLKVLTAPGSPYAACRVFPHLDHGQPDADRWLLEGRLDEFAMVMHDASALPFDENIARTAAYVKRFRERVVIEGAVDELKAAGQGAEAFPLTTIAQATRFLDETGCDLIVPNVGTEHRAAQAGAARYSRERAQEIAAAVGPMLVLHGTSCLGDDDLSSLPYDGFVKVNIWTILEKTGAQHLVDYVLRNIGRLVERPRVKRLLAEGLLGEKVVTNAHAGAAGPDLDYFPLINIRRQWVREVAAMIGRYFDMLGYARLSDNA
jgi:fructose-bisphosphate aldolase class II